MKLISQYLRELQSWAKTPAKPHLHTGLLFGLRVAARAVTARVKCHGHVGMGPRYVCYFCHKKRSEKWSWILTKSHRLAFKPFGQAVPSYHLAILKIACIYWSGALPFEIAWNLDEPIEPSFLKKKGRFAAALLPRLSVFGNTSQVTPQGRHR